MAAPKEMTTRDISGTFSMNKQLSDDTDEVLILQNVSWFTRTAISLATITLVIKHITDDAGIEHIDISQTMTGGIKGTSEARILDWKERSHSDYIFGNVIGKSRRLKVSEIEDEFLRIGWTSECQETGVIESFVVNNEVGWTAQQIWGFEEVEEQRRYVRHLKFTKGPTVLQKKLVYDYQP